MILASAAGSERSASLQAESQKQVAFVHVLLVSLKCSVKSRFEGRFLPFQ